MPAPSFTPCEEKLRADGAPALLIETFRRQFALLAAGQTGLLPQSGLAGVGKLPALDDLREDGTPFLARTVIINLNGGLGTSMGLEKAKSLLPLKNGQNFLDIMAAQVLHLRSRHGIELPLVLMNSYSTDQDSLNALARHAGLQRQKVPLSFLQHRVPKLRADNFEPVRWPADPEKEWCPPGHGDIYVALQTTGLMKQLLDGGFEYAFVSNVDNLGATLDLRILGWFAGKRLPFLMEVTDRTAADSKGGHLARMKSGGLLLREIAQCPEVELDDFQNIERHRFFNTNNLWLNLRALADRERLELPLIINRKTVDPRDAASPAVAQLETAMGSAISIFPGAQALRVPRTRFSPVKTTDDLLALWSDAYVLAADGHMKLNARRNAPPVIKLDPKYYRLMDDFSARFPHGAPSLMECESLTVEGDFTFGKGVKVKGRAVLRSSAGAAQTVPDEASVGN